MTVDERVEEAGARLAERPVAVPELSRVLARGRQRRIATRTAAVVAAFIMLSAGLTQLVRDDADLIEVVAGRMSQVSSFRTDVHFEGPSEADGSGMEGTRTDDVSSGRFHFVGTASDGEDIEYIGVDGVVYLRNHDLRRYDADTPWVAAPEDGLFPAQLSPEFPAFIEGLRRALGPDEEPDLVGEERVRGVATERYEVVFTDEEIDRYHDRPPSSSDVSRTLEIRIWVDDDDLIRKRQTITTFTFADGQSSTARETDEYYDFDADVPPIQAPPPDQVTTFDSVQELLRATRSPTPRS